MLFFSLNWYFSHLRVNQGDEHVRVVWIYDKNNISTH